MYHIRMRILHFSDIHFWERHFEWQDAWYPKRTLGFINLSLFRHKKFPPSYAQSVCEQILKEDADLVIFSGDMSTMSPGHRIPSSCRRVCAPSGEVGRTLFRHPGES